MMGLRKSNSNRTNTVVLRSSLQTTKASLRRILVSRTEKQSQLFNKFKRLGITLVSAGRQFRGKGQTETTTRHLNQAVQYLNIADIPTSF